MGSKEDNSNKGGSSHRAAMLTNQENQGNSVDQTSSGHNKIGGQDPTDLTDRNNRETRNVVLNSRDRQTGHSKTAAQDQTGLIVMKQGHAHRSKAAHNRAAVKAGHNEDRSRTADQDQTDLMDRQRLKDSC